ncbi:MAG: TatD family hydrolase [Neisseriaceae bacterium]
MLVDSHCHLYFPELFSRLPEVMADMHNQQVGYALVVGVDKESLSKIALLIEQQANLFGTVGIHPVEGVDQELTVGELVNRTMHPKMVGIGETGLDYYHRPQEEAIGQKDRFIRHIEASNLTGLPLIIHTRAAGLETLEILEAYHEQRAVIHCFTENKKFARKALELGCYISFSGIVTFKKATEIQEVCAYVPEDRLLVETDAPYLAPVPLRGKVNEPAYVRHTAEFIAKLRQTSFEQISAVTTQNFFTLFSKAKQQLM